jgi:hypothetical protein
MRKVPLSGIAEPAKAINIVMSTGFGLPERNTQQVQ